MKPISIISFFVMLCSCQSKNINMNGVESITVVSNLRDTKQDIIIITDEDQIKLITGIVKEAKREPLKFLADYRLELKFKDSTLSLLVRKDLLNNQGITYRLNEDIGIEIENIKKATH
jgi:hypothetical protein